MAVVTKSIDELRTLLQQHLDGGSSREVAVGREPVRRPPSPVFLYSGQGGQYPGMGRGLYRNEPVFRAVIDRCAAVADPFLTGGLKSALWPAAGREREQFRMADSKLGTFAISMALTELWASWGVRPAMVMGFSSGEYGAACAAGALSLEDAVRLLGTEAQLTERVTTGATAVVALPEAAAQEVIAPVRERVGVAAVVSDSEVSLSGDAATLQALQAQHATDRVRWVYLPVRQGLHSPLQAPAADELAAAVKSAAFAPPTVPMVSTVTGAWVDGATLSAPDHWQRHLTGTIRFQQGLRVLDEAGGDVFVEIGPGRALTAIGPRALPGRPGDWWASLGRSVDGRPPMLRALAALYVRGQEIARPGRRAELTDSGTKPGTGDMLSGDDRDPGDPSGHRPSTQPGHRPRDRGCGAAPVA
jgi:acyl transferase domain-containing protein